MQRTTTGKIHYVLGVLWMAIYGYLFANLVQGIYESTNDRFETRCLNLLFVMLFLAGAVASFFLLLGARWGRIVVSIVALLTVTASVMGLFAFFDAPPFSFVGVMFDIFALVCAGVLLLSRQHVSALPPQN